VIIYKKNNNCEFDNSNKDISKLIKKYTLDCQLTCKPGQILDFDLTTNKEKCTKCPENTYSTGGNRIIHGSNNEWTENNIKPFSSKCYNIYFNYIDDNNCSAFISNEDNSLFIGGKTNKTDIRFMVDLFYGGMFKNGGEIKFKYRKDTIKEDSTLFNGVFRFYLDYQEVIYDYNINSNFITCKNKNI
jgi:hypothetical protein